MTDASLTVSPSTQTFGNSSERSVGVMLPSEYDTVSSKLKLPPKRRNREDPTVVLAKLKTFAIYEPETGHFIVTATRRRQTTPVGSVLRTDDGSGYYRVCIDYRFYRLHMLAWLWMTGDWPQYTIDHINGDRKDNRFCNLRDVPIGTQAKNSKLYKANKTGYVGVRLHSSKKYDARVRIDNREYYLGLYPSPEEAYEARVNFLTSINHDFTERHGQPDILPEHSIPKHSINLNEIVL